VAVNPEELKLILLIGLGGALGSILRYLVQGAVSSHDFPWGTLLVNFMGSLLLAMIFFSALGGELSPEFRMFLFVGVFGGFTTLSTFSLDTVGLLVEQRFGAAVVNMVSNGGLCVLGALAGRWLGAFAL
jgi:CrcB protein